MIYRTYNSYMTRQLPRRILNQRNIQGNPDKRVMEQSNKWRAKQRVSHRRVIECYYACRWTYTAIVEPCHALVTLRKRAMTCSSTSINSTYRSRTLFVKTMSPKSSSVYSSEYSNVIGKIYIYWYILIKYLK